MSDSPGPGRNPARILLLDTGKEWGGGTNSMLELLKRVPRDRFSVHAVFYHNYTGGEIGTVADSLRAIGVPVRVIAPPPQPRWARLAKELARLLFFFSVRARKSLLFRIDRAWRIDPLMRKLSAEICAGQFQLLYLNNQPSSNLEGLLAAQHIGVSCIQHCRIECELNAFEVALANKALSQVICVSQGVRDSLIRQGIADSLCEVIHNGIEIDRIKPTAEEFRRGWKIPQDAVLIGAVGSLVPRKRVADLLQAFALLARGSTRHNLRLLIIGEGPEHARLHRRAIDLNIGASVTFTGFLAAPLTAMAAVDIAVSASEKEGLPRVLLEAMWLEKPVVATDIVGTRELVVDGTTGWLVSTGDVEALAMRLGELSHDPQRRKAMGQAGGRRVAELFRVERYAEAVQKIWSEALAQAPATAGAGRAL